MIITLIVIAKANLLDVIEELNGEKNVFANMVMNSSMKISWI